MGISSATAALVGKMLGANRQRWIPRGKRSSKKKNTQESIHPTERFQNLFTIFLLGKRGQIVLEPPGLVSFFNLVRFSKKTSHPSFFSKKKIKIVSISLLHWQSACIFFQPSSKTLKKARPREAKTYVKVALVLNLVVWLMIASFMKLLGPTTKKRQDTELQNSTWVEIQK